MKTLHLSAASLAILSTLLLAGPVRALTPVVNYHAGRYVGTMQITTTDANDPFLHTSTTLSLKGRSNGSQTLRLVGTPQSALPLFSADDYPMKVFELKPGGPSFSDVLLHEYFGIDTNSLNGSSRALDSQTVTNNAITARVTYQRTFGGVTFDVKVVIKLKRL